MRGPALLAISFVSFLGLAACGGNVVGGTGASGNGGGGTGATGTGATGPAPPGGDCTSDAQCSGGSCVPVTPGGYEICTQFPPEATTCSSPGLDECCTSADCKNGGKCYAGTGTAYCGGPAMQVYNHCLTDACAADGDCTSSGNTPAICAPAGAFGDPVRTCFVGYCHTNADCTAKPGGACEPVSSPCCSAPSGLGCVYPGGCATDADCGQGNHCTLDPSTGTGLCVSGPAACPV